ncbi:MAG: shikimate dehydrogenase [Sphingobacteriales bacterium]|jgi:shikimate dehydrogenase
MIHLGLIGYPLSHSFSKTYFSEKFEKLGIEGRYDNFAIKSLLKLSLTLRENPTLEGFNLTIPHKEKIIPFLNILDPVSLKIKAVNTVAIERINGKTILKGYNTDVVGFEKSFTPHLKPHHKNALVLGTGGASKAIIYVLNKLGIQYNFVSRNAFNDEYGYGELTDWHMDKYSIIINCTPLGTFPHVETAPKLPYEHLTDKHYLFDLVYNPSETVFLKNGREKGAFVKNGLEMLEQQAEAAWEIWEKK